MKPAYPEAWNGLGHALRNQGKYPESLKAYDEALRLRPDYPDALEYLGEAYVKLGRLDDARRLLDRLRPLDGERARELPEAIARGQGPSRAARSTPGPSRPRRSAPPPCGPTRAQSA